jgi:hypothetical protein
MKIVVVLFNSTEYANLGMFERSRGKLNCSAQIASGSVEYHRVSSSIVKYRRASSSIVEYRQVSSSIVKYRQVSSSSVK